MESVILFISLLILVLSVGINLAMYMSIKWHYDEILKLSTLIAKILKRRR